MSLFSKLKSSLMGSIKADLNSALSGHRALFNSNIANSLDDLVASATGIKLSNVPKEIQSHAAQMKATASAAEKKAGRKEDGKAKPPKKAEQLQFPSDAMKGLVKNWISLKTIEDPNLNDPVNIWLPMPKYTDDVSVGYSTKDINLANSEINRILEGDWSRLGGSLAKGLDEGWQTAKEGMTSGLQALAHGAVINPVKFQLFEGVSFRTHSYTWDLHPFNSKDSANIERIIYLLKMASLPQVEEDNLRTYKLPAAFQIDFHNPEGANMSTYEEPLLSCLTKVSVDYSGGHDMGFIKIDREMSKEIPKEESGLYRDGIPIGPHINDEQRKPKEIVKPKIYPNGVQLSLEFTEISTLDRNRYRDEVSYIALNKNKIKSGTLVGGGNVTMANSILKQNKHQGVVTETSEGVNVEPDPTAEEIARAEAAAQAEERAKLDKINEEMLAGKHGSIRSPGPDGRWGTTDDTVRLGTEDRPIEMWPAPKPWYQKGFVERLNSISMMANGFQQDANGVWWSPQGQKVGRLDDFGDDG